MYTKVTLETFQLFSHPPPHADSGANVGLERKFVLVWNGSSVLWAQFPVFLHISAFKQWAQNKHG